MSSEMVNTKPHSSGLSVNRGLVYVGLAATAWGTGGAVAAMLYEYSGLGPVAVSFWRFAIGVGILALAAFMMSSKEQRQARSDFIVNCWGRVVVIGIGLAIYQTAYFAAVQRSGLAIATVVTLVLGPILIAIGAYLTMGERITKLGILTIACSILGLTLLTSGDAESNSIWGLFFALLSAVGYACVTLMARAIGRYSQSDQFNVTLFGNAVGAACLLPFSIVEGMIPVSDQLLHSVILLGYLGFIPTAIAYLLFNMGLSAIRATTASILVLVEPITATAIAVLFLNEKLTLIAGFGLVILMGSVLILALSENSRKG
ncbi:DMT family transporter [Marinomonas transparens]|uniref:EamA family transporter n=1 Tax=Marinomonas transparens TaxID=2795388 RepID=A0A934JW83_9GAMM|nr:EamA family transporter [Marinomonas transparens]MBJ7538430.1 EamA family transporter [Marinomonas transparens]